MPSAKSSASAKTSASANSKTSSALIEDLSVGESHFLAVVLAGFSFWFILVLVFKFSGL